MTALSARPPHVFVAFHALDKLAALQLAALLLTDGVNGVCIDYALDDLAGAAASLEAARVLLVLLSQNTRTAEHVVAQWTRAWLRETTAPTNALRRPDRPVLVVCVDAGAAVVPASLQFAAALLWQPAAATSARNNGVVAVSDRAAVLVRRVRYLLAHVAAKPWQPAVWALPPGPRSGIHAGTALCLDRLWPSSFNSVATGVVLIDDDDDATSELALQAAHQHRMRFTRAWRLDGSSKDALMDGLRAVALSLGLPETSPCPSRVQERLCEGDCVGWLLIVEGVDSLQLCLRSLLPRTGGCILVVSQRRDWSPVDWVVLHAAEQPHELHPPANGSLPPSVLAVTRLQQRELASALHKEPALSSLLQVLQLLHPAAIGRSVLTTVHAYVATGTPTGGRESLDRALSLIQSSATVIAVSASTLVLDRAAQAALRLVAPCNPAVAVKVVAALSALANDAGRGDAALTREVLAHTAEALSWYQSQPPHAEPGALAQLLALRATILLDCFGQAKEARPLLERALALIKSASGPDHVDVAEVLASLGSAHLTLGDVGRAADLLERARAILTRHRAPVVPTMLRLGNAYLALGEIDRAKAAFEQIAGIAHVSTAPEETAATLAGLGNVHLARGDVGLAKHHFDRALAALTRLDGGAGSDHPVDVAAAGAVLVSCSAVSEPANARQLLLRQALALQERWFGPDHPAVASTLTKLADAYAGDEEYDALLERAEAAASACAPCDVLISYSDERTSSDRVLQPLAVQLRHLGLAVVLHRASSTAAAALTVAARTATVVLAVVTSAWLADAPSVEAARVVLERIQDDGAAVSGGAVSSRAVGTVVSGSAAGTAVSMSGTAVSRRTAGAVVSGTAVSSRTAGAVVSGSAAGTAVHILSVFPDFPEALPSELVHGREAVAVFARLQTHVRSDLTDGLRQENTRALVTAILGLVPTAGLADAPGGLTMPDDALPTPFVGPPSKLLLARHEVVPFVGRGAVLVDLTAWCMSDAPMAVRVVYGAGGVGKTRTMLELVRRLRAQSEPMLAGFVRKGVAADTLTALADDDRRVVAILDYADGAPQLPDMLRALAAHTRGFRFRLIQLARSAGDWLVAAAQALASTLSARLLAETPPMRLDGVDDLQTTSTFGAAVASFAGALGVSVPTHDPPPSRSLGEDSRFGRILYIHMAALATVLGVEFTADSLADAIVAHEMRIWDRDLAQLVTTGENATVPGLRTAAQLVLATATLRGGVATQAEAHEVVKRIDEPFLKTILQMLHRHYGGHEPLLAAPQEAASYLPSLQPDFLGERLVSLVLTKLTNAGAARFLVNVFSDNDPNALQSAFNVLARMSCDDDHTDPWIAALLGPDVPRRAPLAVRAVLALATGDHADDRRRVVRTRLGQTLASTLRRHGTTDLAAVMAEMLPRESVALREVAVWATGKLVEAHSGGGKAKDQFRLSTALVNHSVAASAVGEFETAMHAAMRAEQIARGLVARRPGNMDYLGQLQKCLTVVCNGHCNLGHLEESVATAREALQLARQLCAVDRSSFLPEVVASLYNLSSLQDDIGQYHAALATAEEAVRIGRNLAADRPSDFLATLALTLICLGNRQASVNQHDAALESTYEAVAYYRELAVASPDMHLSDLAASLCNIGDSQRVLGQYVAAMTAAEEAV